MKVPFVPIQFNSFGCRFVIISPSEVMNQTHVLWVLKNGTCAGRTCRFPVVVQLETNSVVVGLLFATHLHAHKSIEWRQGGKSSSVVVGTTTTVKK